jgi:REP element-mobilizing transposase RayT
MEYRYGSHAVFRIEYHFVFVTKYCYKVLKGDVGLNVRELYVKPVKLLKSGLSKELSVLIMYIF